MATATGGGTRKRHRASSGSSATGAWARKMASQPASCVRMPPIAGPSAAPSMPARAHTCAARCSDPSTPPSRTSAVATSSAAPAAWTQRPASNTGKDDANPHASDAAENTTSPAAQRSRGAAPHQVRRRHSAGGQHEVVRDKHPGDVGDARPRSATRCRAAPTSRRTSRRERERPPGRAGAQRIEATRLIRVGSASGRRAP